MTVTVRELIEQLQKMDPTRIVVLQKDGEGNDYSPLSGVDDNTAYLPDSTWYGEVKLQALSDEQRQKGFDEHDLAGPNHQPCVVLYPVN